MNEAHLLGRQADKLVKSGRWEEAVGLQDKIVEQLEKALVDVTDRGIIESLEQQIVFHGKQKERITQRRKRCEKINKELVNLRIKMEKANLAAADGLQVGICHCKNTMI